MRGPMFALPCVAALVAALAAGGCAQPSSVLTKGPYLQNPTATAITVQWETERPGAGQVFFRPADASASATQTVEGRLFERVRPRRSAADTKAPPEPRYLYRARLLNLAPETEYVYGVHMDFEDPAAPLEEHTFRTWPDEPPHRVQFIFYGDTRTQTQFHRALVRQFEQFHPAFILHNGDLVEDGNVYGQWGPQFFDPLRDVMDHIPMFIARGNHEGDGSNVLRFFDMPEGRLYYSFDCGPVHVTVLDMDAPGPAVLDWIAKDLASAAPPWKIVLYHKPTFNFDGHRSDEYRLTYLRLFEEYGADVVLAGHSHHYERFFPLRRQGDPEGRPITFITDGGGGAPLVPATQSQFLARAISTYCYMVFTATEDTLAFKTLTNKGVTIDDWSMKKVGGRYDATTMAQSHPMEEAILEQGLLRASVARAKEPSDASLPGPSGYLVKTSFPGIRENVAVSVRLSDASAKQYSAAPSYGWALADGKEIEIPVTVLHLGRPVPKDTKASLDPDAVKASQAAEKKAAAAGKKPKLPDVKLVVTARVGAVERSRDLPGIGYERPAPPPFRWPGPWAEHSDKKPAPVGVTYTAPPKEKKKDEKKPAEADEGK